MAKTVAEAGNGWIDASERLPDEEGRYLIVYRHEGGRIMKPFIGDYYPAHKLWASLPINCTVVLWMPIPAWDAALRRGLR